jgi:hypothetical protein
MPALATLRYPTLWESNQSFDPFCTGYGLLYAVWMRRIRQNEPWYGIQKTIETEGSMFWIAILVISFIAVFFGIGVLSSKIKL